MPAAEPTTMLPSHELDTFLLTVEEAIDLARTGHVAEGYEVLLAGLHRATGADHAHDQMESPHATLG
jgi:hypothetical protein